MATSAKMAEEGGRISMSADEKLLAELGYKQDFKREFNGISTAAFCFSIMGVLASFSSTLVFPLSYGGHVGMVWGWFTASFFVMFVALAMAELCSAMPTSGGLYYWSAKLAPPKWAPLASWITGWANVVGQVALVCSIDYTAADMISDAVSISSDFTVFYGTGIRYGILVALLFAHGVLCSSATRVLAKLNLLYVAVNLGGVLATIVCLAKLGGPKQSAQVAFTNFQNNSTWSSPGFAWILSMTAAMWSLTGYDSAAHIAEETSNAARVGPIAIVSAVAGTAGLGWALSIVASFAFDDSAAVLDTQLTLPAAQLYYNVIGKNGMLALWAIIIVVQFNTAAAQAVDASRVVFAFARDGALPFSGLLARMNSYTQTPVNATWFTVIGSALLGLLTLQETAGLALFSTAVMGLYVSYAVPILFRITSGRTTFKAGYWSLGRASVPIGCVACAWVTFIVIVLLFPANAAPGPADMNYSVLILGFVLLASGTWWILSARKWFKGPIKNIDQEEFSPSTLPPSDSTSYHEEKDPSHADQQQNLGLHKGNKIQQQNSPDQQVTVEAYP